jgi:hypothetical protein
MNAITRHISVAVLLLQIKENITDKCITIFLCARSEGLAACIRPACLTCEPLAMGSTSEESCEEQEIISGAHPAPQPEGSGSKWGRGSALFYAAVSNSDHAVSNGMRTD